MDLSHRLEPTATQPRAVLLAAGLRVTRQRAAVYGQVLRADHPTAEAVYREVKTEVTSVSLATVYNALDALVASGLVTKVMVPNGSARYDARRADHYHLRCLKTGAVVDLTTRFDPDLIAKLDPDLTENLDREGFQVTGYRLEVVGYFKQALAPERSEA